MKKLYLILLLGFLATPHIDAQAPRRVLVEEFTQASCPPCAVFNPAFHAVLFTPGNETKVSLLSYQVNWPGSDPMNLQNPTEVANRVGYYGINAVPDALADGGVTETGKTIFHGNLPSFNQSIIDTRAAVTSPFEITLDHNVHVKLDSVTISVHVKNVSSQSMPDVYTLHTILTEKTIHFASPPGTNGELDFYSVMRKMLPNASGTKLGVLAAGASKQVSFTISIPSFIYSLRNLGAIAFVQNTSKKEIMQAAESLPKPMPAASTFLDLKVSAQIIGYAGLCDPNVTLKVQFFNEGTDSIRTVSVDLILNNIKQTGQTALALNLAGGASGVYEFKNINLKAGKNALNFRINNINGVVNSKDIDKLNHTGAARVAFNVASNPFATELHEGFEVSARGVIPANLYVEDNPGMRVYPADKAWLAATEEIGGFGKSNFSLWWDFYSGSPETEVKMFYNKLNLSNSTNTHLILSRAYAQLYDEAGRFIVEASKDCGANWTIVYQKEGAELATTASMPFNYYSPLPGDWISDTVSMTEFDGTPEVVVRLRGYNPTGGSNFLFIDDINIAPLTIVATEDPGILSGLTVYPNPVHEVLQLEINSKEEVKVNIQLVDLNGKTIALLAENMKLASGKNITSFNVKDYSAGLYNVKILSDKGVRNTPVCIH